MVKRRVGLMANVIKLSSMSSRLSEARGEIRSLYKNADFSAPLRFGRNDSNLMRVGLIAALLCVCMCCLPCYARASSTAQATEPIRPETACTLTLSYGYESLAVSHVPVKLYRVAEVSADFQYTLTAAFAPSGLTLNGIQTNGEWNVIRTTLEAVAVSNGIAPDGTGVSDQNGQISFSDLKTGLYLAVSGQAENQNCRFASALIALPGLGEDGTWQYQLTVAPKPEGFPPEEQGKEIELKILKLWKGDENTKDRPSYIEVEIFCDGKGVETVKLSDENDWFYSWLAEDNGEVWTVAERDVPKGYTVTVEKREGIFVLTNTHEPTEPDDTPKTGDSANIMLYVLLMILSGSGLIVLGAAGKRK